MLNVSLLKTKSFRCRLVVRGQDHEFRVGVAFGWHLDGVWSHVDLGVWMVALAFERYGSGFYGEEETDG